MFNATVTQEYYAVFLDPQPAIMLTAEAEKEVLAQDATIPAGFRVRVEVLPANERGVPPMYRITALHPDENRIALSTGDEVGIGRFAGPIVIGYQDYQLYFRRDSDNDQFRVVDFE